MDSFFSYGDLLIQDYLKSFFICVIEILNFTFWYKQYFIKISTDKG